jgi:hypothetical protein
MLINELSIRIGQRVAYHMATWHEIITWYGYKGWGIVPEDRSSFTYDDTASHMIGIYIAAAALRDTEHDYEQAVTLALGRELVHLGVVSRDEAIQATELVEGQWWQGDNARRRYVQVGIDGETFEPWLVDDPILLKDARPVRLALPAMRDVLGRDLSNFYRVEIEIGIAESESILSLLSPPPQRISPVEHFPTLKRALEQAMH